MAQPRRRSGWIVVLIIVVLLLCLLCCCVAGFLLIRQGVVSVPWENLPMLPSWFYSVFGRITQDLEVPGIEGLPGLEGLPGAGPGTGQTGQTGLGDLEPGGIFATGEGIQGPVMTVQVANPRDTEVMASLSCGFIFAPDDNSEQRMMVIQQSSTPVPAGGEVTLTPYVICIDAHQGAPGGDSSYSLGGMAEGQLLQLAQCICQENLEANIDPMADLGLQFAVWMTSSGQPFEEMMTGGMAGGALGDLLGPEATQILGVLQAPADAWLQRCNINLGQ
jgi:hypothetical protein